MSVDKYALNLLSTLENTVRTNFFVCSPHQVFWLSSAPGALSTHSGDVSCSLLGNPPSHTVLMSPGWMQHVKNNVSVISRKLAFLTILSTILG